MFNKILILLLITKKIINIQNLLSKCSQITISRNNQYLGYYPNRLSDQKGLTFFSTTKNENSIFTISDQNKVMGMNSGSFALKNKDGLYLKVNISKKIIMGENLDSSSFWKFNQFNDKWLIKSNKYDLFAEFDSFGFRLSRNKMEINDLLFFVVECATTKNEKNFNSKKNDFLKTKELIKEFENDDLKKEKSLLQGKRNQSNNLNDYQKKEIFPLPCKRVIFQNAIIKNNYLTCSELKNSEFLFFTPNIMESSVFDVEKIGKKFGFKALNGKFLKSDRNTFYKDVYANGDKYDPSTLWNVQKIGNVYSFKNNLSGYLKGGRELPNAQNPFKQDYAYWLIKCAHN